MTVAAHFPCELDEIGERSAGPTDDRGRACCPKRYRCVVSSAGGVEVRRRDDRRRVRPCSSPLRALSSGDPSEPIRTESDGGHPVLLQQLEDGWAIADVA